MRALLGLVALAVLIAGCTSGPKPIDTLDSVYADSPDFLAFEYPQLPGECKTNADCSVQGYFHEVCTNSEVRILEKHGNLTLVNNTVCICVQSMCQWVPQETYDCPKPCPAVVPPHADFCDTGNLVPTPVDQCGCEQMLSCVGA